MKYCIAILLTSMLGCVGSEKLYVRDDKASMFDFDQKIYKQFKMEHGASVEEVIRESEQIFICLYGKDVVNERPWRITEMDDCYLVCGTLPEDALGGVAQLKVRKCDGLVHVYYHGE